MRDELRLPIQRTEETGDNFRSPWPWAIGAPPAWTGPAATGRRPRRRRTPTSPPSSPTSPIDCNKISDQNGRNQTPLEKQRKKNRNVEIIRALAHAAWMGAWRRGEATGGRGGGGDEGRGTFRISRDDSSSSTLAGSAFLAVGGKEKKGWQWRRGSSQISWGRERGGEVVETRTGGQVGRFRLFVLFVYSLVCLRF